MPPASKPSSLKVRAFASSCASVACIIVPDKRASKLAASNIADTANRLVARMDQVLSEQNIERITATIGHIEQATGSIAGQREDIAALIVNTREATDSLKATLATANGSVERIDREVVAQLPALMAKLDATVGKLDSVAGNANAMIAENRPALQSFTNDGLAQLGPVSYTHLTLPTSDLV